MAHLWNKSITGHLIQQCLEQLRLEVGLNGPLLSLDYYDHESLILTDSWLQHTWQFVTDYGININPQVSIIDKRRVNDKVIMQEVLQAKVASPAKIKAVNECRLYLNAFHLSDIVTANGKEFRKDIMHGTQDKATSANVQWPLWGKPAPTVWATWRRILRLVFTNGLDFSLLCPLKQWLEFDHTRWK